MDASLKTKWVKALRGGKYEQGYARFERDGRWFCCLGVLCSVAGEKTASGVSDNWSFADEVLGRMTSGENWSDHLSVMNDSRATFPEIADYIEANL